jgi:hypothetical protein
MYVAIHLSVCFLEWKLIVQFYFYCFLVVVCILPFVPLVYATFPIHCGKIQSKGPFFFFMRNKIQIMF